MTTYPATSAGASANNIRSVTRIFAAYACPDVELEIPENDWFKKRRDVVGDQASCFAWIAASQAPEILQAGFDETQVDGVSTMNIWIRIKNKDGEVWCWCWCCWCWCWCWRPRGGGGKNGHVHFLHSPHSYLHVPHTHRLKRCKCHVPRPSWVAPPFTSRSMSRSNSNVAESKWSWCASS